MANVPYELSQGQSLTISNPALIASISGNNPTPFYIHFPLAARGQEWIFPFTYSFLIPFDPPLTALPVNTIDTPPNWPNAPVSTAQVTFSASDQSAAYLPGTRSPGAATLSTKTFISTAAAFTTIPLIAAIPTKAISIYGYSVDMAEALATIIGSGFNLVDFIGAFGGLSLGNNTTRHWDQIFPLPIVLPVNDALEITNGDSVQHTFVGYILYTQL